MCPQENEHRFRMIQVLNGIVIVSFFIFLKMDAIYRVTRRFETLQLKSHPLSDIHNDRLPSSMQKIVCFFDKVIVLDPVPSINYRKWRSIAKITSVSPEKSV